MNQYLVRRGSNDDLGPSQKRSGSRSTSRADQLLIPRRKPRQLDAALKEGTLLQYDPQSVLRSSNS